MTDAGNGDDRLLPPGTVLLHIGPHKTGTTALQGSLRLARPTLPAYGVVYAGRERSHMFAALAVTAGKGLLGDPPMEIRHWNRLVRQVRRERGKRVVVSSEFFDGADDETAARVVEELGGPRVHVVVTLRPLAKILPSAWQQYVRNRLRHTYDEWLDAMFRKPPYIQPTTTFWKRHHHDVQVKRWADVVGPGNLTVIVVDENDRSMLTHTFEDLLGLPRDLLVPETGWVNRSLTRGEIELVRLLNVEFKDREWSNEAYKHFVRLGVVRQLQSARRPAPDEEQIVTPQWALERAGEIGAAAAKEIEQTGVRIIGDISTLGTVPTTPDEPVSPVPELPSSAALQAVLGAVLVGRGPGAGDQGGDTPAAPAPPASVRDRPTGEVGTRDLARLLGERLRERAKVESQERLNRARALRRRGRSG